MKNQEQVSSTKSEGFYRFQVFLGDQKQEGQLERTKSIGMAYLKEGQNTYTLRLWTLINDRFYVIPSRNDSSTYLIMTRELNKNPVKKGKYFWNIVGNGKANSKKGCIELNFDLFERNVYMSIFPEASAHTVALPEPFLIDEVA